MAWLLNLRGGDVPYNPVFVSYVLLTPETAALYMDAAKVRPATSCTMHTPWPLLDREQTRNHACDMITQAWTPLCSRSIANFLLCCKPLGAHLASHERPTLTKVTPEAAAHLEEAGVAVKPYAALLRDVRALAATGTKIWADPAKVCARELQTKPTDAQGYGAHVVGCPACLSCQRLRNASSTLPFQTCFGSRNSIT